MRLTFKGDYALKIILDLSLTYNQKITQIKDMAKRQDIPEKFLEQIITLLKSAKYIKTVRGPKGGVYLAKPPAKITLGEIIRLMEGPTAPVACVSHSGYTRCTFENKCVFKGIWSEVRDRINDVVDKTTFQDMVEKNNQLHSKHILNYTI
ncbi:MAG: Rrf2 family transcriptional regulator [Elusimicrobia bacterium]|nr:Rrf2 family transcriptional regulator [Elusimicrobiota bacterium]MBU2613974.1 Rrf2 family transcriptional regulator [Elusimicrobiota bacterium]